LTNTSEIDNIQANIIPAWIASAARRPTISTWNLKETES
jgi:hypothetical protein